VRTLFLVTRERNLRVQHQFTKMSMMSGKEHTLTLNLDINDYTAWQNGKLIQNAMPYLTSEEREFLMTGITPAEWHELFKNDKDDEEGKEYK
jgi:hypothetical protein